MWKKNAANGSSVRRATHPKVANVTNVTTPAPPAAPARIAHIGGSVSIKGDLYGEEDLFIEGRIEGKITVKKGSVTVGEKGRVQADIKATNIQVASEVEGDLTGREQVVLLETGRVHGDIKAKSVTLQNGAQFKGSIDIESAGGGQESQASGAVSGKANGASATQRL